MTDAVWSDETVAAVAVKEALEAPKAIATVEGTVSSAVLLLDRAMEPAAVAGFVKVAVQFVEAPLATVEGLQETEAN